MHADTHNKLAGVNSEASVNVPMQLGCGADLDKGAFSGFEPGISCKRQYVVFD